MSVERSYYDQLSDAIRELAGGPDIERLGDIVARATRELVDADGATLVLRDGDQCHYVAEDAVSPLWAGERFPMASCISGWVMLRRAPAAIENIYIDERIPHEAYRPTFVSSLAMVPIRSFEPIGAIGAYWADRHQPTAKELMLLRALAEASSDAVARVVAAPAREPVLDL